MTCHHVIASGNSAEVDLNNIEVLYRSEYNAHHSKERCIELAETGTHVQVRGSAERSC